jgi:hypothetical protein
LRSASLNHFECSSLTRAMHQSHDAYDVAYIHSVIGLPVDISRNLHTLHILFSALWCLPGNMYSCILQINLKSKPNLISLYVICIFRN